MFDHIPKYLPSLCLTRVNEKITVEQLKLCFSHFGKVKSVTKKDTFVYIQFKEWSHQEARERLLQGKQVNLVYEEPWFFKVNINKRDPEMARYKLDFKRT